MERLSPQDAVFLYLEGPVTPYHVGSVMIFDRGDVGYDEFCDLLGPRLHLVPRLRQKLRSVPFGGGRPYWVDDEHFDLRYHVRQTTLPEPGTEDQLLELCSTLMEEHLDRARPLWELYMIDGLDGGRGAMFAKTHHAMVDGIAGVDVTAVLLDDTPIPREMPRDTWSPEPAPTQTALLTDAVGELVLQPRQVLRQLRRLAAHPRRLSSAATGAVAGIGAFAWAGMHPAPRNPLNVRIGPSRAFAAVRTDLAEFKAIKERLGGHVNDVVLAVVCGGLRRWFLHRREPVHDLVLHVMVPVSIRTEEEAGRVGNRVSTIIAPLPLGVTDPLSRYEAIRDGTVKAKQTHQVAGGDLLLKLSGFTPPTLAAQVARFQNVQRYFNLTVTNIPGPQQPLYAAGRKLLDLFPFTPLAGNMALIVAVVSYDGRMEFGLTADRDAIPDLDVISRGFDESLEELRTVARPEEHRRTA